MNSIIKDITKIWDKRIVKKKIVIQKNIQIHIEWNHIYI